MFALTEILLTLIFITLMKQQQRICSRLDREMDNLKHWIHMVSRSLIDASFIERPFFIHRCQLSSLQEFRRFKLKPFDCSSTHWKSLRLTFFSASSARCGISIEVAVAGGKTTGGVGGFVLMLWRWMKVKWYFISGVIAIREANL